MTPVLTIVAGFGRGDLRSSRLKKAQFKICSQSLSGFSAHLVGCGWSVSVVLSGIFILGTDTSSKFSAPNSPQFLLTLLTNQFQGMMILPGTPTQSFQTNNNYLKRLWKRNIANLFWGWTVKKFGIKSNCLELCVSAGRCRIVMWPIFSMKKIDFV